MSEEVIIVEDDDSGFSLCEQDDFIIYDTNHIHVYLRIKSNVPFEHLYDLNGNTLICKVPEGSHALRNVKDGDSITKKFSFSKIFGPETKQLEIFNDIVKPKLLEFINGKNSTLMTYGASGAGKTFTIVGTASEPGLVPRALEYLFRTLPQLSEHCRVKPLPNGSVVRLTGDELKQERMATHNILKMSSAAIDRKTHIRTYTAMQQRLSGQPHAIVDDISDLNLGVWISFAEIYNEFIYDLLKPDPPRGKQRPKLRLVSTNGNTYIKDLSTVNVTSGIEAYQILQYGLHNLNYAATSVNSHSSRSHCIFTIKLAQASNNDDGVYLSSFNFCDLAGSERVKKTLNEGDRLKESNNINTSLLVLGRCIQSIRTSQKQNDNRLVPFRESKLTQLFQKALSGHEGICMIVNINPSREMFDETQHVLNFSAIAKTIIVEEQVVKPPKKMDRFSLYMQSRSTTVEPLREEDRIDLEKEELRDTITQLCNEIERLKIEKEQMKNEFETDEIMNRAHVMETYQKMIALKDENHQKKLDRLKGYYEMKLHHLYKEIELLKEREVIDLDSSNESEEMTDAQCSMLQQEIAQLTAQVKKLTEKFSLLEAENMDLKMTLEAAERQYSELESLAASDKEKIKDLRSEIVALKEMVNELEEEVHVKSAQLVQKSSVIEELEDVKEKYLKLTESSYASSNDVHSKIEETNKENFCESDALTDCSKETNNLLETTCGSILKDLTNV